jgi:hypothetical protein
MTCREGAPSPIAFPRFFNRHITPEGILDPHEENTTKLVKSLPTLTHAQSSAQLQPYFKHMRQATHSLNGSKLTAAYGISKDDIEKVHNDWYQLEEDYEFHGSV